MANQSCSFYFYDDNAYSATIARHCVSIPADCTSAYICVLDKCCSELKSELEKTEENRALQIIVCVWCVYVFCVCVCVWCVYVLCVCVYVCGVYVCLCMYCMCVCVCGVCVYVFVCVCLYVCVCVVCV